MHPTARPIERYVERGVESKLLADECIRDCAEVQNLTLAITQCLNDAKKADPTSNRPPALWMERRVSTQLPRAIRCHHHLCRLLPRRG